MVGAGPVVVVPQTMVDSGLQVLQSEVNRTLQETKPAQVNKKLHIRPTAPTAKLVINQPRPTGKKPEPRFEELPSAGNKCFVDIIDLNQFKNVRYVNCKPSLGLKAVPTKSVMRGNWEK